MAVPLRIFGRHDANTLAQMETCLATGSAAAGVLCADGHLGYNHPIGGVVGYEDHISISGVGFDIACGNKAVRLDTRFEDVAPRVGTILRDIARNVSFGLGRANKEKVDDPLFESDLWQAAGVSDLKKLAREQLGTVGGGNHYVDLFRDDEGFVWIGVHFGSRGLGTRSRPSISRPPRPRAICWHPPRSSATRRRQGYSGGSGARRALRLCGPRLGDGEGAPQHRRACDRTWCITSQLLLARTARASRPVGRAQGRHPGLPGQRGFVGGSMGDDARDPAGRGQAPRAAALYSTVHGAGRVMSRSEAKGKVDRKTGRTIRPPRVDEGEMRRWLVQKGVQVVGGDLDEAPQAYRRLPDVLAEHGGTVEVEHVLHPFGVVMAGPGDVDPYKD
jgi:tRNA-splicing ligase RtcB